MGAHPFVPRVEVVAVGLMSYVYPPTMLAIDASASLARSKKFSIHVEEPAFGTLSMAIKIIESYVWKI